MGAMLASRIVCINVFSPQFGPVHWNGTRALFYSDCWSSRLAVHQDLHCWDCKHASCAVASVPVYSDLAVASMSDFPW